MWSATEGTVQRRVHGVAQAESHMGIRKLTRCPKAEPPCICSFVHANLNALLSGIAHKRMVNLWALLGFSKEPYPHKEKAQNSKTQ